jgi:DNA-binding MarR family transcriptional regulator
MPVDGSVNQSPCHCAALRKAARRVTQVYDAALASSGLTVTQFSTLAEIDRCGKRSPTMGELAEVLGMDRSTLGHSLRPLQRDRLIQLTAGEEDRRSRRVSLTPAGKAKFTEAIAFWRRAQDCFESTYGSRSAVRLRNVLNDLADLNFAAKAKGVFSAV